MRRKELLSMLNSLFATNCPLTYSLLEFEFLPVHVLKINMTHFIKRFFMFLLCWKFSRKAHEYLICCFTVISEVAKTEARLLV